MHCVVQDVIPVPVLTSVSALCCSDHEVVKATDQQDDDPRGQGRSLGLCHQQQDVHFWRLRGSGEWPHRMTTSGQSGLTLCDLVVLCQITKASKSGYL